MKFTKRALAAATFASAFLFITSSASALPSVDLVWRNNQTATVGTPSVGASSTIVADIVLRGSGDANESVIGVFVSLQFDNTELNVLGAEERSIINLPGMGNTLAPVGPGTVINQAAGTVSGFDVASTSAPGLSGLGQSRSLGSVRFHIIDATGDNTDIDVIAGLFNAQQDDITFSPGVGGSANFVGASVTGPVVPEPTTAFLLLAGLAGLGYAGRRNLR